MAQGGLTYQFKTADVLTKVIVINGLVFLGVTIFSALFQIPSENLIQWFVLPEELGRFITQPWSIITYNFLHTGFFHVLFNMLWLYFFGRYVLNLFSGKRFLTLYLLGGISGGILYMISYNFFPAFVNANGTLLGASASVMAIMAFAATYSPNAEVRIFTIRLKLWYIAVFMIIWNLLQLRTLQNPGGILAHLGGALFGYVYARQLIKGTDIGAWFDKWMDAFVNFFKPQKKPFKKVHRNEKAASQRRHTVSKEPKDAKQQKIDAILDKIGKSGYDSLTKAEKDFLFRAGKDN